jgi:hypothetical protein
MTATTKQRISARTIDGDLVNQQYYYVEQEFLQANPHIWQAMYPHRPIAEVNVYHMIPVTHPAAMMLALAQTEHQMFWGRVKPHQTEWIQPVRTTTKE